MDTCTRMMLGLPEHRAELGISLARLSRLAGVSRRALARLENGELWNVDPVIAIRVATVLMVLDSFAEPEPQLTLSLVSEETAA